jgi:hypothetical protein
MVLSIALMIVAVIANLWLVVKIWRVSVPYAIVSFIFFPAAMFFMFAHWSDEEHDIKVPFILALVCSLLFVMQAKKVDAEYGLEEEEEVSMHAPGLGVVCKRCWT